VSRVIIGYPQRGGEPMRERHNLMNAPAIRPTLEAVRHQFETWRKRRRSRDPIPESLWQAAIGLCQDHSMSEVSRRLRLNYNALKDRVSRTGEKGATVGGGPDFRFVRLDLGSSMIASEWVVEMKATSGARMRMTFNGSPRELDPMELGRLFWRQGDDSNRTSDAYWVGVGSGGLSPGDRRFGLGMPGVAEERSFLGGSVCFSQQAGGDPQDIDV